MSTTQPGLPWNGQEYNEHLSLDVTLALGRVIVNGTNEAILHPGLYLDRTDDIITPQLTIRPGVAMSDELALLGVMAPFGG